MGQDWFTANAPKSSGVDWFAANAPKSGPAPKKTQTQEPPTNTIGDFGRGVWNVVNPIEMVKGLATTAASLTPLSYLSGKAPGQALAESIAGAQTELAKKTAENVSQGDYLSAVRTGVDTALPILGPALDASSEKIQEGKWAEGGGELAAQAALLALGARKPSPATTVTKAPRMAPPVNPAEAAAVAFARAEGIPLDLATATGNQRLRNLQKRVGNTVGGGATADALQMAQAENLARVGEAQAAKAAPVATNPVAAGEGVRNALTKAVEGQHATANAAYGRLRDFERKATPQIVAKTERIRSGHGPTGPRAQRVTTEAVETGAVDATGQPIRQSISVPQQTRVSLAIDLGETQAALKPILDRLLKKRELTGGLVGAEAKVAVALDSLVNGPPVASLSTVDAALSDLKSITRGADMPELRNQGQGVAAFAVRKLDAQVRARAAQAGPEVLKALEEGRAATRAKYATADVLDMLSGEPGQVFRQLTQAKDVGLERLKAVQRLAPKEMENIGRAFLEDAIQQATAEGGFTHADRLWSNWQKLGGQTKQILFPKKGQIQALDNFFLLAKKIKENPNPSGTATIPKLNMTELLAYVPAKALAKMLMTPASVKYLTDARVVTKGGSQASRAYALSNLAKAAQSAGVPLDAIPALAGETERDKRP